MKKKNNKLTISRLTLSNLQSEAMEKVAGGTYSGRCHFLNKTLNCTANANTCAGHKTCYTC